MDLTAAEAVIDLIDAETVQEAHNAALQLNGAVARPAGQVYDALMEIASRFYAVVDYPDEDIEPLQQEEIACTLQEGEAALRALLSTAERGRILKKGVRTAIPWAGPMWENLLCSTRFWDMSGPLSPTWRVPRGTLWRKKCSVAACCCA